MLSESSRTDTVVTASAKEDKRGGQGHTSASLFHQSDMWHRTMSTHCFYTSAFSTSCFILSTKDGKIKQHVCIKFCVKLDKSAIETLEILRKAFEEHSLSRTVVFEWHLRFKASWVSAEDNERSGWPSTSKTENMEKIQVLIHEDHCQTIHELADTAGIRYKVCPESLTENFNMCHIAAKLVPRVLISEQKQRHINMCLELQEKAN
jgi:hypothetical protein